MSIIVLGVRLRVVHLSYFLLFSVNTRQVKTLPALFSVSKLQLKQLKIRMEISLASWSKCKSKLEDKL